MKTADVVIVGGGVVGMSIAYQLARREAGAGVVVIERNTLGSGSTARSAGGIRSQFSTEINIRFALESVEFWLGFEDEMGMPLDLRQDGYLYLATTPSEREQFALNVALQRSFGIDSELLEPEDAAELVPGLRVDDLTAASFHAGDAVAGPSEATSAFAKRAREGGVQILEGVEVIGIDVQDGVVRGVRTPDEEWSSPLVVNAAGPWASEIGKLVGIQIPVAPYRRGLLVSEPFVGLPPRIPFVIDAHAGWYFRREGDAILMSGHRDRHMSYDTHVEWSNLAEIAAFATHRVPMFQDLVFGTRGWAGLYEITPDDHAILGTVPDIKGLLLACGFSGHGFQHSPATGRLLAELILDGRTTGIDITPLNITRFEAGSKLRESLSAHSGSFDAS